MIVPIYMRWGHKLRRLCPARYILVTWLFTNSIYASSNVLAACVLNSALFLQHHWLETGIHIKIACITAQSIHMIDENGDAGTVAVLLFIANGSSKTLQLCLKKEMEISAKTLNYERKYMLLKRCSWMKTQRTAMKKRLNRYTCFSFVENHSFHSMWQTWLDSKEFCA